MPTVVVLCVTHLQWQWGRPSSWWTHMGWTQRSRTDLHPLERLRLSPECRSLLKTKTATISRPFIKHLFVIRHIKDSNTRGRCTETPWQPFVMGCNSDSRWQNAELLPQLYRWWMCSDWWIAAHCPTDRQRAQMEQSDWHSETLVHGPSGVSVSEWLTPELSWVTQVELLWHKLACVCGFFFFVCVCWFVVFLRLSQRFSQTIEGINDCVKKWGKACRQK